MDANGFHIPLPYVAGELAASCLAVLAHPLHKMYGKVNIFLQKHPSWEIEKIPSYWIDKILLREPEYDDGYGEEMNWLLDLLIRGLRTPRVSRFDITLLYPIADKVKGLGDISKNQRLRASFSFVFLSGLQHFHEEKNFTRHLSSNSSRCWVDTDNKSGYR